LAALDLARDALTIDPENDAAQRMIARLEEVINYRGVAAEAAMAEIDAVGRATPESAEAEAGAEPAATKAEAEAESEAAADVAAAEAEAGSEPGIAEPLPEVGAAADAGAAETEDASEPERAESEATVVPGSAPEPQIGPQTRSEPEPVATEPEPPRSRSFLDRLFRRR